MFELFDELNQSINAFSKIDRYSYVIGVVKGNTISDNYTIDNDTLLYILDNGSPRNDIIPYNLTRRFSEWFNSEIAPKIEAELYDRIVDGDYDERCIKDVFESYKPIILNWYRNEVRKCKALDFNMKKFANKIYCKILCKDI